MRESVGLRLPPARHPVRMLARIAVFDNEPDRFTTGHKYAYVIEVLRNASGCRGAFHLAGETEAMSISFWEDEASMAAGTEAIAAERERLDLPGSPPAHVTTYTIANQT